MDLGEFIEETIGQVMRGVARSTLNLHAAKIGGMVSPQDFSGNIEFSKLDVRSIDFDVAVTVESSSKVGKSGKAGIKVIEGSIDSQSQERRLGESRVKFSIPVIFPGTSVYNGDVDTEALNKGLADQRGPI